MDFEQQVMNKLVRKKSAAHIELCSGETPKYFNVSHNDRYSFAGARIEALELYYRDQLEITEFQPATYQSTKPFYSYGMVVPFSGQELTEDRYLLNLKDHSNVPVKLNLSSAESYSIFNGQCVAIKGRNPQGNELLVDKVYALPIINIYNTNRSNLSLHIMKGPFSQEILEMIINRNPDVILLFGPFTSFEDSSCFTDYNIFTECIESKIRRNIHTRVILVPSLDDYNFIKVLPQYPGELSSDRVTVVANPSSLTINNHLISVVNFDSLKELSKNELYKEDDKKEGLLSCEKMKRLSYHLIFQHSYIPCFPSSLPVAWGSWLTMKVAPDILITSSTLDSFNHTVGKSRILNIGNSPAKLHTVVSNISDDSYTIASSTL